MFRLFMFRSALRSLLLYCVFLFLYPFLAGSCAFALFRLLFLSLLSSSSSLDAVGFDDTPYPLDSFFFFRFCFPSLLLMNIVLLLYLGL